MLNQPLTLTWHDHSLTIAPKLKKMLLLALVVALVWWLAGWLLRTSDLPILVWDDLQATFSSPIEDLVNPYATAAGFLNPPWTMIFLIPFDPLPLELNALAYTLAYFVLLALVVQKFGGGLAALGIALTSPLAFDTVLEINIDWLVCIGLLVPPAWSAPFLMVKPQAAWGYVLSFTRRDFVRAIIGGLVTLLLSFILWPGWPLGLLESLGKYERVAAVNLAPWVLLPTVISLLIGLVLGIYAFRKRDPLLSVLAGVFFVPYISPNSALIPFTLLAVRFPLITAVISGISWLIVAMILW